MKKPININLVLVFFVAMTWGKAGLAEGITRYILLGIGSWIIVDSIVRIKRNKHRSLVIFVYFLIFTSYFWTSFSNPTYKELVVQDLEHVEFNKRLQNAANISGADLITKRVLLALETSKVNKIQGLALFNDLKLTYKNTYSPKSNDDLWNLINDLEKRMLNQKKFFGPSMVIQDINTIYKFCLLWIIIYIFLSLFMSSFNHDDLRKTCYILLINSFVLTLVGVYQKINYNFEPYVKEILGIWDAPEPRYYFSTFTYKNHWSAFAILSIFIGFSLLSKPIMIWGVLVYRSKEFLTIILLLSPIIFSVPFSGSRSGTILISLSAIILALIFINKIFYRNIKLKIFIITIIFVFSTLFISIFFIDNNKISREMTVNTKTQYKEFLEGKFPLRYYLWVDALRVGNHSPFFGWGYESYSSVNPLFQSSHVKSERSKGLENAHTPYIPLIAHAHSDILEWWCEWGTIGIILFFIPLLVLLISQFLGNRSLEHKILLAGVLVIFLYSAVDFPTRTPACFALTMICFGMGICRTNKK